MVRINNIGRDERFIWCNYCPENEKENGFIKVDLKSESIVDRKAAPYELRYGTQMYTHHAMIKLLSIQNANPLPLQTGAIWF